VRGKLNRRFSHILHTILMVDSRTPLPPPSKPHCYILKVSKYIPPFLFDAYPKHVVPLFTASKPCCFHVSPRASPEQGLVIPVLALRSLDSSPPHSSPTRAKYQPSNSDLSSDTPLYLLTSLLTSDSTPFSSLCFLSPHSPIQSF
jgi:hypothetical protein